MGRIAGVTAEDTRAAILDAASAEFAAKGYEGARLARIATAAGLSPGAIYNHYRSKADLLLAVVERSAGPSILRLVTAEGDARAQLPALGRLLEQVSEEAPLIAELILASRRDRDAGGVLIDQLHDAERLIADRVRSAQAANEVAADLDAEVIARFSMMVGLGALLVRAAELPPKDPDGWGALIVRLVGALGPKDPKASRRAPAKKKAATRRTT